MKTGQLNRALASTRAVLASELLAGARTAGLDAFRGADGAAFFRPAVVPHPGAGPADQLAAFLGRQG
jgi:hypothetical protein